MGWLPPMLDRWLMQDRDTRNRRCPSGLAGGASPRSTSWRSWPPMTPLSRARRARSCAGKGCTPATSWSGGEPATPGRWQAWPAPAGGLAPDPRDAQIARLNKEKARLEQELAKARFVVEVQAKLQALLETLSEGEDTDPK